MIHMGSQDEGACCHLADVRWTDEGLERNGKLLFRLEKGKQGIAIALKTKGDNAVYRIPIYDLLEPYISDIEGLKKCTKLIEHKENEKLKIS